MAETELPEHVMVNILCWLPVKSLIRFTSVSKRWRFIILSDPQFAASQFNAARQRKTLSRRVIFAVEATKLDSVDLADTESFGHPSSVRKLSLPLERLGGRGVTLLGSCNGLVFVVFDVSCFYIWNPATRFLMELPGPGFTDDTVLTCHGVGYLSATDDYRVLAASHGLLGEDEENWVWTDEMKMFSSRAHLWKTVPDHTLLTIFTDQGVLLNEALHWTNSSVILAFDFAQEEFRTMSLPDDDGDDFDSVRCNSDDSFGGSVSFHIAGVSEGCLCVYSELTEGSVHFWVMREYGVDNSWTKIYNFHRGGLVRFENFLVMESCIVASKWGRRLHLALVRINHKRKEEFGTYMIRSSSRNNSLKMISYEESLLQINA